MKNTIPTTYEKGLLCFDWNGEYLLVFASHGEPNTEQYANQELQLSIWLDNLKRTAQIRNITE